MKNNTLQKKSGNRKNYQYANFPRASFMRRLGASLYDLLLAVAVYIFAGVIGFGVVAALIAAQLISLDNYADISAYLTQDHFHRGIYQLWLVCCVASFYALFWSKGGQTLGMRAWRLKLQHPNGQNLSFITALARVGWSLIGLGNLRILMSADQLALQDLLTRSEVVVLSKDANSQRNWHGA